MVQNRRLFVFSAKSKVCQVLQFFFLRHIRAYLLRDLQTSLASYLSSFEDYLDEAPDSSTFFKNLSYTLGQRRTHFPYRAAVVAESLEGLQESLSALKPLRAKETNMTFVFTGQGAQYAQMAAGLRCFPVFAHAMADADAYLKRLAARWSLSEELAKPEGESRVNEAEISQPACTAVQLGLVALLRS